jgi:hypothetical protein
MPKVTVYKVKIYDLTADERRVSRRMATEKGAATMGGEIIRETGIEIRRGSFGARRRVDTTRLRSVTL